MAITTQGLAQGKNVLWKADAIHRVTDMLQISAGGLTGKTDFLNCLNIT